MADATKIYNDAELLTALAAGSDRAFNFIYKQYWEKVYLVARLYLKDENSAEDIVQEVFLSVWKKRAALQHVEHLEKYLHTMARNLIVSSLRKKIPPHQPLFDDAIAIQQENNRPSMQLEYKEMKALVTQAVGQLSPRQKELYAMSSEEQLPLKEAAIRLNISYSAARQYKSEAFRSIRTFLKKNLLRVLIFAAVAAT